MAQVILEEQGLRDGLQTVKTLIPTEKKLDWIRQLEDAGIQRIQITSFVHPKLVPQMADAEQLFRSIELKPDVVYSGLVLNKKGVERAIDCGAKHLAISISASDLHSQKNTRMTLANAKTNFAENVQLAHANGIKVRAGIQCAFGCRFEGVIPRERVFDLVKHHLDKGVEALALADSTGMGNPQQVFEMMSHIIELSENTPITLHLHNTENKGLANVYAGYQAGIRSFDTAFGGLGGCPFIPGATGNIATEDTAHMFHQMGIETGIDIPKISKISLELAETTKAQLSGSLYKLNTN